MSCPSFTPVPWPVLGAIAFAFTVGGVGTSLHLAQPDGVLSFGDEDPPPFDAVLRLELADVERVATPSAEKLKRIAVALDAKVEELDGAAVFRGRRPDGTLIHLARVPLKESEKENEVFLALAPGRAYVSSAVVDADFEVVAEWEHFMQGLKWAEVPRLEGARPWSAIAASRKQALEEGSEDGKLFVAMLDLMQEMNNQAAVFNLPREGRKSSRLEEAELMARAYENVAALTPALEPLLGDSAADFEALATASASLAREFVAAQKAEDVGKARSIQRKISSSCGACHKLESSHYEGELKDASSRLRRELGIGDGLYRVGHDLRIRHPDRERMQLVANGLRAASLLIDVSEVD